MTVLFRTTHFVYSSWHVYVTNGPTILQK